MYLFYLSRVTVWDAINRLYHFVIRAKQLIDYWYVPSRAIAGIHGKNNIYHFPGLLELNVSIMI